MRKKSVDHMIIGAGFAGLSTAYHLIKQGAGSICIVEKEREAGLAASGRNASMICQIVRDTTLCRLMLESTQIIKEDWLSEFPEISFNECGSLHIGREEDLDQLELSVAIAEREFGVGTDRLSRNETLLKYPYLERTEFDEALVCFGDGIIDIKAMTKNLLEFCEDNNARFIHSEEIFPQKNNSGLFEIETTKGERIQAKGVINAAGAWAGLVGAKVNAQDFKIKSLRRHIFVTKQNPLKQSVREWPIVWDMPNEIYFRPDKNALQLSPCDEALHFPGPTTVDPNEQDVLRKKLKTFLPQIMGTDYERSWSGLRTFSPDRRFVIGWDGEVANFFWVACLGGYGMTASAGVGKLAADLILGKTVPRELQEMLSPKRFLRKEVFV